MVKMLADLKKRLSTIRTDSWHYKLAKYALPGVTARNRKACPYYWVIVPGSTIVGGIKLLGMAFWVMVLVLVASIGSVGYQIWTVFAWFFGYQPRRWTFMGRLKYTEDRATAPKTYGYKRKVPGANRKSEWSVPVSIAPYQVALPLLVGVAMVLAAVQFGPDISSVLLDILPVTLVAVASIAVLYLLGLVFRKIAAPWLRKKYDQWCPEIVWELSEEKAKEEETVNA